MKMKLKQKKIEVSSSEDEVEAEGVLNDTIGYAMAGGNKTDYSAVYVCTDHSGEPKNGGDY